MILPAQTWSDLEWDLSSMKQGDLIEFDFGWKSKPLFINDPAVFHAYTLALDKFTRDIWPQFHSDVVLYRGSLNLLTQLVVADGELTPLEAANVLGSYLHRLASFLPEEAQVYCLFNDLGQFTKGEAAQLLSADRFAHLKLTLEPESNMGVLLPPDELMTPQITHSLTKLLEGCPSLRVIPEKKLNELWAGLDELFVFENGLSTQGKRQLLGFEAAGGKIRSRGI